MVGPGAVSRPAVGGGARDPTLQCVVRSSSSRVGQERDISDISDVCHLKEICTKNSRDKSEDQERHLNVLAVH